MAAPSRSRSSSDFRQITRARSFPGPIGDRAQIGAAGRQLLDAECPVPRGVRLLGLSLSGLGLDPAPEQLALGF